MTQSVVGSLVAPCGTMAVSWLAELTVKRLASVPPTATLLALVKPLPESVTVLPTVPLVGVKLLRVAAGGGEPPPPWPVPSTTLTLSISLVAAVANPMPPLVKVVSVPDPSTTPLIEPVMMLP
jgi:hypothetical protein